MSEAIPLNTAPQLQAYLSSSLPLDSIEIMEATVIKAPAPLSEATRPLQINGMLLSALETGELSVRSSSGEISLQLNAPSKEALSYLQDLLVSDGKTQKPLTLLLQPDKAQKATLLVPKSETTEIKTRAFLEEKKVDGLPKPIFINGKKISLTVLPDKIDKSILAPEKQTLETQPQKAPVQSSEKTPEKTLVTIQKNLGKFLQKPNSEQAPLQQNTKIAKQESPVLKPHPALQKNSDVRVHIDKILAPEKEWPPKLAANQIKATVIGKSHSGHLVLSSEGKTLFAQQSGHLETGSRMVLTLLPNETPAHNLTTLPSDQAWGNLRELVTALAQNNMEIAQNFLQSKIPSPAQSMAGATLFFLSAMKSGKLEQWLGAPALGALKKGGKHEIIERMIEDLSEASKVASDKSAGEWKAWPLPIHCGQAFDMLRLYVRQSGEDGSDSTDPNASKKKTRFVITMNMSHLGPIQMEGLARTKQLDLIIRSEKKLPDALPASIRSSYAQSMEAVELAGTITFKTGRENWVIIEDRDLNKSSFVL